MVLTTAQALGILVGAILTLMMYTFLYKDNVFYKFGEHLYVGISVGYMVNLTYWNVFYPQFIVPAIYQQEAILIIPMILGLMMLARFIRQVAWLSRTPMAFVIGVGSGLAVPAVLNSSILQQLNSTIRVLWFTPEQYAQMSGFDGFWQTMSLWLIFIGVLSVLFYFYFSIEHKGIVGKLGTVGIWFIMVSFGAAFGYTVMARVSLFIGRVQFLLNDVPRALGTLFGGGA